LGAQASRVTRRLALRKFFLYFEFPFCLEYELCDDDEQDGGDEHQEWSCLSQKSCHGTFFSQSDLPKFRQAAPQNFVCHVNLQAGLANFESPYYHKPDLGLRARRLTFGGSSPQVGLGFFVTSLTRPLKRALQGLM
jgi:hypothetical protein